jgi:hypothetical protein
MGAADLSAWRRQNSDVVPVSVVLIDGTRLTGSLLLPRDKKLHDLFNMSEPFIEFDDARVGPTVLAKAAVRSIYTNEMPAADQLEKRMKLLEKMDPFQILGVPKNIDRDGLRAAYVALARAYHPDRFAQSDLPGEIVDYVNAMARRINAAYSELQLLFGDA